MEDKANNLSFKQISEVYNDTLKVSGVSMFLYGAPKGFKWTFYKVFYPITVFIVMFLFILIHVHNTIVTDLLGESMMALGLIGNSISILIRFFSVVFNGDTFKSCFLEFETLNSNLHRSKHSHSELSNAYNLSMKILKWFKIILANTYCLWYLVPFLISPEMVNFYKGNGITYKDFRLVLPASAGYKPDSPIAELRFLSECAMVTVTLIVWPPLYIIYFTIVYMLTVQYEILGSSLKHAEGALDGDDKKPMAVKYVAQDHIQLLRVAKGLKNILSPLLATLLLNSTILICCLQSAFTSSAVFTKESNVLSVGLYYVKFVSFSSVTLMELFLFSWFSFITDISNKKLAEALYESAWYENLKKEQTDIIPPIIMSQRDLSFTALNLIPINLATYLDVIKFSYTYFTFMKGARENEE